MKIVGSIIIIILGILFFRVGSQLINQMPKIEKSYISEEDFWDKTINIDIDEPLGFTAKEFFLTIPELELYPTDKVIYFKLISSKFFNDSCVIQSEVIQDSEVIFKNSYYFKLDKKVELIKILTEDLNRAELTTVEEITDLKSIMTTYKSFIDLWVLYNLEK